MQDVKRLNISPVTHTHHILRLASHFSLKDLPIHLSYHLPDLLRRLLQALIVR
jgi:hypothetical protein